jgi:hypothetical protein
VEYVDRCDAIARAIADAVENDTQGQRFVTHHDLPRILTDAGITGDRNAHIQDGIRALETLSDWSFKDDRRLSYADLRALRDPYSRWVQIGSIQLTPDQAQVLCALNALSERQSSGWPSVEMVNIEAIIPAVNHERADRHLKDGEIIEILDEFEAVGWAERHHVMGLLEYQATYDGLARMTRNWAARDLEIDRYREVIEGDTHDFKRILELRTVDQKREFARDVSAMANAGGLCDRVILVGIENDGTFYRPEDESKQARHNELLDKIRTDQLLQQVTANYLRPTPSLSVKSGTHRQGRYVLISITPRIEDRPYRVVIDREDRTKDEVWIRKGSHKFPAEPDEIENLERHAEMKRRLMSGFDETDPGVMS